uniref:Cell adhesion molecule 3-like isoform X1 n=2 Tax=Crassostrea virginica TaxID=6565 RepID=A0A8B8D8B7_CRAVI|nr:cell adhesion molecule 3-like isoform X1 [Crassostrea virginica]
MIVVFFCVVFKGIIALSANSPTEIKVSLGSGSTIVLNCSFEKETGERVSRITWTKKQETEDTFITIISYYQSYVVYHDLDMKNRSNSISFTDSSPSAILNISEVQCKDDGQYQCIVGYMNSNGIEIGTKTETSVYIPVAAEIPVDFSLQPHIHLQENNTVNFTCLANAGHPEGKVIIWRQTGIADAREKLGESPLVDEKTENCITNAQLTISYNISKYDDGAFFGCTAQNKFTPEDSVPSRIIGPLNIFYGPSNLSIEISPQIHSFYVGDRIRLTCSSEGNPRPTFQWTFNFTKIAEGEKYYLSDQDTTLEFNTDNITDSGYYGCFASNSFNGNLYNSNDTIKLIVQDSSTVRTSCVNIKCSSIEKCTTKDNIAICSVDLWKIVAFLFISCSLVLGTTTAILWRYLKLRNPRTILDEIIRDGENRNYETLSNGTTARNVEERNYESLSNVMTDTYSSIDERALRDGEGAHYESLGSGETHTYSSIQPTVLIHMET